MSLRPLFSVILAAAAVAWSACRASLPRAAGAEPRELQASERACTDDWVVVSDAIDDRSTNSRQRLPMEALSAFRMDARTVAVTGNSKTPFDDRPRGEGVVVAIDGKRVAIPREAASGIRPRIGVSGDALYLLWGRNERPAAPLPNGRLAWPPNVESVWFAYKSGENSEWSRPQKLFSAANIAWNFDQTGSFELNADGSMQFAFLARKAANAASIVDITIDRGRPTVLEEELGFGAAGYVSTTRAGDVRFLSFVAADPGAARDLNSVLLMTHRKPSGWSKPIVISRSGDAGATVTKLVATDDGVVHLVWSQSREPGLQAGVVRHVSSRDLGRTWSAISETELRAAISVVVPLDSGGIAVLYETTDGFGPSHLNVICFKREWTKPRAILPMRLANPSAVGGWKSHIVGTQEIVGPPAEFRSVLVRAP